MQAFFPTVCTTVRLSPSGFEVSFLAFQRKSTACFFPTAERPRMTELLKISLILQMIFTQYRGLHFVCDITKISMCRVIVSTLSDRIRRFGYIYLSAASNCDTIDIFFFSFYTNIYAVDVALVSHWSLYGILVTDWPIPTRLYYKHLSPIRLSNASVGIYRVSSDT